MRTLPLEPVRDFRRREIGMLLRSRRTAIRPEEVGLPRSRGRRQLGLRMEDVAELAGVSLSWYARFEAGHEITISPRTLTAVTTALRMSPYETTYLFTLTGTPQSAACDVGGRCSADDLRDIVEGYVDAPAIAVNYRYDIVAVNEAAKCVFGFCGDETGFEKNCVWRLFMVSGYRALHRDEWVLQARRMVDNLRTAYATHVGDPDLESLILELSNRNPEFCDLWHDHAVAPPENARFFLTFADGETVPVETHVITTIPRFNAGVMISYFVPSQPASRAHIARLIRERRLVRGAPAAAECEVLAP